MDPAQLWKRVKASASDNLPFLVVIKLLSVSLPIAQIVIGAVHLQDCPQQRFIPVYLLVCGAFGLLLALLVAPPCTTHPTILSVWNGLVSTFLFCWVIAGSVWIYSIYPPNFNRTVSAPPSCERTLYLFAFWSSTLGYVLLALLLLLGCGCCVCVCVRKTPPE